MVSLSARALFYGVVAALLTGCSSGRSAPPPLEQAAAQAPRVTLNDVKSAQETQAQEIARLSAELKAQDAQQSFLVAELKTLSDQLAKLKASLDEAESAMRGMRATPVAPESRPAAPPAPPPASAPTIAPAPPSPPASAAAPPAAAAPPPAPAPRNVDAERQYAGALARLRAGDDGQAALEFAEFVAQFPAHPLAAAAQNNIGEAFYRQRDYRQAATEFQKTVDNYTQAAPVSEALVKIGLSRRALGDVAGAREAWELVIKQFPKSEAARQARTFLASKTGSGR